MIAPATGTILAASQLEACTDTGSALNCAKRMVITMTAQNGQNATESVQAVRITTAMDAAGNTYDVSSDWLFPVADNCFLFVVDDLLALRV